MAKSKSKLPQKFCRLITIVATLNNHFGMINSSYGGVFFVNISQQQLKNGPLQLQNGGVLLQTELKTTSLIQAF